MLKQLSQMTTSLTLKGEFYSGDEPHIFQQMAL